MCMRLGADSGRNFLSTDDPVRKSPDKANPEDGTGTNGRSRVQRLGEFEKFLRQLYNSGVKGR